MTSRQRSVSFYLVAGSHQATWPWAGCSCTSSSPSVLPSPSWLWCAAWRSSPPIHSWRTKIQLLLQTLIRVLRIILDSLQYHMLKMRQEDPCQEEGRFIHRWNQNEEISSVYVKPEANLKSNDSVMSCTSAAAPSWAPLLSGCRTQAATRIVVREGRAEKLEAAGPALLWRALPSEGDLAAPSSAPRHRDLLLATPGTPLPLLTSMTDRHM